MQSLEQTRYFHHYSDHKHPEPAYPNDDKISFAFPVTAFRGLLVNIKNFPVAVRKLRLQRLLIHFIFILLHDISIEHSIASNLSISAFLRGVHRVPNRELRHFEGADKIHHKCSQTDHPTVAVNPDRLQDQNVLLHDHHRH